MAGCDVLLYDANPVTCYSESYRTGIPLFSAFLCIRFMQRNKSFLNQIHCDPMLSLSRTFHHHQSTPSHILHEIFQARLCVLFRILASCDCNGFGAKSIEMENPVIGYPPLFPSSCAYNVGNNDLIDNKTYYFCSVIYFINTLTVIKTM